MPSRPSTARGSSTRRARPSTRRRKTRATSLRRTVRRSMVLQTAKLRVDEVRDWMRPTQAPTVSRPLSTYLPEAPAEITQGLEITRQVLADAARRGGRRGHDAGARPGARQVPAERHGLRAPESHGGRGRPATAPRQGDRALRRRVAAARRADARPAPDPSGSSPNRPASSSRRTSTSPSAATRSWRTR